MSNRLRRGLHGAAASPMAFARKRSLAPRIVIGSLLMALCGCQSLRPPDTELLSGQAAGLNEAIAFRVEGGQNDEPGDHETLTMAEAIRMSVMTDPGIQASLARVRIALAEAKQARLLPNPVLNLALRFPESGGKPVFEASLAQDLISILSAPKQSRAADNRLRRVSAAAIAATVDAVAEVQERYVSVQALEQLLPVFDKRRVLVGKAFDLAKARLSAGEGIREDVAVLETQRVELDVEIAEAMQELRDERLRLTRLIGRPSGAAAWKLEPSTPPTLSRWPETSWIDAALRSRPEIQEKAWKLAALGDDLALTRLLPMDGTTAGVQAQRDGAWQTGPEVSVPIPVFDMGQARAERATAEQIEARHELVQVRRQVIEDVRRSFESLTQTCNNARRVHQELIPLQEKRRSLAEATFRFGQSDVTALILAEHDLRSAEAKAVEFDRKAAIAAIRLERAVGGPGPSGSVGANQKTATTTSANP